MMDIKVMTVAKTIIQDPCQNQNSMGPCWIKTTQAGTDSKLQKMWLPQPPNPTKESNMTKKHIHPNNHLMQLCEKHVRKYNKTLADMGENVANTYNKLRKDVINGTHNISKTLKTFKNIKLESGCGN